MLRRCASTAVFTIAAFGLGMLVNDMRVTAQGKTRVFELRTYTMHPGKLDHELELFRTSLARTIDKHGMKALGYWTAADAPQAQNTLVYIVAHESREAAKKSWDAFRADPVLGPMREATKRDGPAVAKLDSVFLNPTDFSPIK
jgi:hypothetical protein